MDEYKNALRHHNLTLDDGNDLNGRCGVSKWSRALVFKGLVAVEGKVRDHILQSIGLDAYVADLSVLPRFVERVRVERSRASQRVKKMNAFERERFMEMPFPLHDLLPLLPHNSSEADVEDDDDTIQAGGVLFATTASQTEPDLVLFSDVVSDRLAKLNAAMQRQASLCAAAEVEAGKLREQLRSVQARLGEQKIAHTRHLTNVLNSNLQQLATERGMNRDRLRRVEEEHRKETEALRERLAKRKQQAKNESRKLARREVALSHLDDDEEEDRPVSTRTTGGMFTPSMVLAVLYCKAGGVADGKVGPLLRRIASCFGVSLSSVPRRTTVLTMMHSVARALVHTQVRSVLLPRIESGEPTTGIFDETTIGVDKLQVVGAVFAGSVGMCSLVLGVPRVVTKASDEQLSVYLKTLDTVFAEQKDAALANLAAVMGDSASTQRKFVKLLEVEKSKLKERLQSGTEGEAEIQELVGVFCQVHALSNAVEPVLKTLYEAAAGRFVGYEFLSLTNLLYKVSRAFGRRASAQIGMAASFETFLWQSDVTSTVLPSFKGNRFFIACTIGSHTFRLRNCMVAYAQEQMAGREKNREQFKLLATVERELQCLPVVLQLRVLVLLDTLVFGPLWAAVETSTMNESRTYAPPVIEFCKTVMNNPGAVFGRDVQVPPHAQLHAQLKGWRLEAYQEATTSFVAPEWEADLHALVEVSFRRVHELLLVIFTDFLPGGRWEKAGDDEEALRNAVPSNIGSERAFGIARHVYLNKPNMLHPRREAEIMMIYNGTVDFLDSKSMDERLELVADCMAQRTDKLQEMHIEVERMRQQLVEKNKAMELFGVESEQRKAEARRRAIANVQALDGCVQTVEELSERLAGVATAKGRRELLVANLRYYRDVLGMGVDRTGVNRSIESLTQDLKKVLQARSDVPICDMARTYRWIGLHEDAEYSEPILCLAEECEDSDVRPLLTTEPLIDDEDNEESVLGLRVHSTGKTFHLSEADIIELIEDGVITLVV